MAANLDRFRTDLDRLTKQGDKLLLAMIKDSWSVGELARQLCRKLTEDETKKVVENLPDCNHGYEAWYSESLAVLRQILPDRTRNSIEFYEKSRSRKSIDYGNYIIQDYL